MSADSRTFNNLKKLWLLKACIYSSKVLIGQTFSSSWRWLSLQRSKPPPKTHLTSMIWLRIFGCQWSSALWTTSSATISSNCSIRKWKQSQSSSSRTTRRRLPTSWYTRLMSSRLASFRLQRKSGSSLSARRPRAWLSGIISRPTSRRIYHQSYCAPPYQFWLSCQSKPRSSLTGTLSSQRSLACSRIGKSAQRSAATGKQTMMTWKSACAISKTSLCCILMKILPLEL